MSIRGAALHGVVFPLNANVSALRALVMYDVSDSWGSLKFAKAHVLERGASEVRVATLHTKPWTSFKLDYYAEEVGAWIVYPWKQKETVTSMAERLRGSGLYNNEVRRSLIKMNLRGPVGWSRKRVRS